VVLEIPS